MVKNLPAMWRPWFDPWLGKISWRSVWLPTPVFWPGEFHGQSMGSQRAGQDLETAQHDIFVSTGCARSLLQLGLFGCGAWA